MSKKSRLRAQKAKQLREKEELEREEQQEKLKAKNGAQSKSAKKYIKSAKAKEHIAYKAIKVIMLVPYAVNCLFFGLVMTIAILFVGINDIEKVTAYFLLAEIASVTLGIVFAFLRKYILAFIFAGGGSVMFFSEGVKFVGKIHYYMQNYYVSPENSKMDVKYMLFFYPSIIIAVCAAALLAMKIFAAVRKRKRAKDEYNDRPTKSIID